MTEPTAPKDIDEALLALQSMNLTVKKTADGAVRQGKPDKYADLGEFNRVVLTELNRLNVIWTCLPTLRGTDFVLAYSLTHVPSGTAKEGDFPIPKGEPQKMGSAITYARRYALGAVTGVSAEGEDDDGRGYPDRQSTAQRANARHRPAQDATQRAQPPVRPERARPEQQPEIVPAQQHQPDEPARGRGGLITEPMTKKLAICMKEIGLSSTEDRKNFITDLIGREVASSKELTFPEGRGLIDAIEKAKDSPDPLVAAEEIYRRTTGALPAADPVATEPARKRAPRRPPETRSQADQTRDAVLGRPLRDGEELPPWEPQHPTLLDGSDVYDWSEPVEPTS